MDCHHDERRFVMDQNHQLEELLETQQAVLEKLTQEGVRRGILDVSTGRNAVYADR